ncbi:ATP phosphoribosyltransferase regulatory subunit [Candidatus Igneacidithiobacillus taiwanensis]|uniref:ATP phosphoribosyltransferase regulatory subunit n=1 Tax=Candidatus Igneacidithiobacillus taiwanensis TaxID=1945924 RepID=UPI0028969165|nr:ATP phosphoribosyltransferase regulatory subunit [Candidatus Igneacidithiobacillus taiwanensis]
MERDSGAANWMLPAGFEDMGPRQAEALEGKRRELLDLFGTWGYRQVIPPMLEHLESLLTGSAIDLDLETWKVLDQASGRVLGFRSDMTPQMARIDVQMTRADEARRLCYAGTVLRARPDALGGSRAPFQVGAELFGVASAEADLEILSLMIESVQRCCPGSDLVLDLGHVAIPRRLAEASGLPQSAREELLRLLERKAWPDLRQLLRRHAVVEASETAFRALSELHGDREVLARARQRLAAFTDLAQPLEELDFVWQMLAQRYPQLCIRADLAEMQGHRYHTGMLFALFSPLRGAAIARGGRYDGVGQAFGRYRPATGFSLDLRPLLRELEEERKTPKVWAPSGGDSTLWQAICDLRSQGYVVVQDLGKETGQGPMIPEGFDAVLQREQGRWALLSQSPELPFSAS